MAEELSNSIINVKAVIPPRQRIDHFQWIITDSRRVIRDGQTDPPRTVGYYTITNGHSNTMYDLQLRIFAVYIKLH